jgi:hypothetical protein
MARVIKYWKKYIFWSKLKSILTAFGVGGEFALWISESSSSYKWIVGVATALAIIITHLFEDKNSNGLVDMLEK